MIALTEQERRLLEILRPVAEKLGMEIVRLRVSGGRRPHLQVMAERAGGAPTDVEDCARLSRAINPVLDDADPIPEAYLLEVSTPGIDRPLTRPGDFARWIGHAARIELARPIDGRLVLTDELIEAARAAGNLPPQPDEDEDTLADFEIDETEDDTDEEETGDLQ